jgi:quinol monooxygenase YgiN
MVQLRLTLRVTPDKISDVIRTLRAVTLAGQLNPGGIRAQTACDVGDPGTVHYLEEWQTPQDAAREVRSARFGRLLELMETAVEPPELQFQFITETRGLDYVAEVREDLQPSTV